LLIQKLFTNYFYLTQQEEIDHLATARTETTCGPTYVFNGSNDRCYRMAKRFHLSMPLFVLPLTVEVTRNTWTDLSNGHIDEGYRIS